MKCSHLDKKGNPSWVETGKSLEAGREYVCDRCGTLHLASEQEIAMKRFFPEPLQKPIEAMDMDRKEIMGNAFQVFAEDKPDVFQKIVRVGTKTSSAIWVPKRYRHCPVTVIIWTGGKEYLE